MVAPEDLPEVRLDPLRTREVVSNLVMNALRYAPRGSAVTVTASPRGSAEVEVTVDDRGPGVPPDVLPRMFQRFVRSDDSGGSGLGLAIARELVEAHGGTIDAAPLEGGGTRVRFVLPLDPPSR